MGVDRGMMSRGGLFASLRVYVGGLSYTVWQWLKLVHSGPYLASKASDFKVLTRLSLSIGGLSILTTLFWDHAIDPTVGYDTLWLRLMQAASIMTWMLLGWHNVQSRRAQVAVAFVAVFMPASFVEVLARLENGASLGMGGFLLFYMFIPFVLGCQPLLFSAVILGVVGLCPFVFAQFGLDAGLAWDVYTAYMLLGIGPLIALLLLSESLYREVYRYRRQIEAAAVTDLLTELPNRRYFLDAANKLIEVHQRDGRSLSLLFADVDRFKQINDNHGHPVGDMALKHLVATLSPLMREDDIFARFGGEEFVVLLPRTASNRAMAIAERLRRGLTAAPLDARNAAAGWVKLSMSIGVADYRPERDDSVDVDRLIREADIALYEAKRQGRNRVVKYDAAMERAPSSDATGPSDGVVQHDVLP